MIDPKRLTDADKGREMQFTEPIFRKHECYLLSWTERTITVFCRKCGQEICGLPGDYLFFSGTYQDGGTE